MNRPSFGRLTREFFIALAIVAVAAMLRSLLNRTLDGVPPFTLMFPAVLAATYIGGPRAGAWTILLGAVRTWVFVLQPAGSLTQHPPADVVSLLLFVVSASAVLILADQYERRSSVLEREQHELRAQSLALRDSEARLRLATEAADLGVWEWRLDSGEMVYSPRARAICGFSAEEPVTIDMVRAITHPDDLPRTSAQAERALDPAIRDKAPYRYRMVRRDGAVRSIIAHAEALFDRDGPDARPLRFVGILSDVTDDEAAAAALAASEARLRLALEAGRMAVWRITPEGGVAPNPALYALFGYNGSAPLRLEDLEDRYLQGELARIRAEAGEAMARGDRYFEVEFQFRRFDGQVRWFNARAEVLMDADDAPSGAIGVVMDCTDRKLAQDRMRLLADEVDHRANNLLSVVQSVVTLSKAPDLERLKDVLIGRIRALARAHQLLAGNRWVGADLRTLAEEELSHFGAGRCLIDGPEVALPAQIAQTLALALHELATNAAKYGALSAPAGHVALSWRSDGQSLQLNWCETGGPPVQPPSRRGFGSIMIERALMNAPGGGKVALDWRPQGLACQVEVQLRAPAG